ncbi:MAG: sporulation protein YunB [Chitinophagales bacterium]
MALLLATLLFVVDNRLRPALRQLCEARARAVAVETINRVVREKVARTMHYEDLYAVHTDSRGKVVLMQPNTGEINRLSTDATVAIQTALRQLPAERVSIPLGQVFGSELLGSVGPLIYIRVIPTGTVETRISDRFEQAGINQTRHLLYLQVATNIRVFVPFVSTSVDIKSEVPLAESIILGEVPQFYFGLSDKSFGALPGAYSQETAK